LNYPVFWRVFRNTIVAGTLNTVICFPAPILLALFFNELKLKRFKKAVQSVSYMPYFVSTIALVSIAMTVMGTDGVLNNILKAFGKDAVPFLSLSEYFVPTYVILNLWRSVGWGTIIYIAAMAAISPELYEAADIDGAGRMRKVFSITLPQILPTVVILLILSAPGFINADFEMAYLIGNEATKDSSEVLATWVFRKAFPDDGVSLPNYSGSAAVGLFTSVLNLVVVLIFNFVSNKVSDVGLF
jgi:putative aldouronate transport system permease protein